MNKLTAFSLLFQAPLASLTDFYLIDRFDVQITGGAEKTANPTGSCKANAAGARNVRAVAGLGAAVAIGFTVVLML
jgi:hypothetical protein